MTKNPQEIIPVSESAERACRTLLHVISERDQPERHLILRDLCSKLKFVRKSAKLEMSFALLAKYSPEDIRRQLMAVIEGDLGSQARGDVCIVVIKPIDLVAAKIAFGLDLDSEADVRLDGFLVWRPGLSESYGDERLSVILTMVGTDGPVDCANACQRLAQAFEIQLFVLCGMAAGLRGRIGIGGVVCVETVFQLESGRLSEEGFVPRPQTANVLPPIRRAIQYFMAEESLWWAELEEKLVDFMSDHEIPTAVSKSWVPELDNGVMLSGWKVIADGSLPFKAARYGKVLVAEMEATGFARACEELRIPWLIFKGVADFGDAASKDRSETGEDSRKIWQGPASLAATICAKNFVRSFLSKDLLRETKP